MSENSSEREEEFSQLKVRLQKTLISSRILTKIPYYLYFKFNVLIVLRVIEEVYFIKMSFIGVLDSVFTNGADSFTTKTILFVVIKLSIWSSKNEDIETW